MLIVLYVSRGSKGFNKVAVGEPAEGSLTNWKVAMVFWCWVDSETTGERDL